MINKKRSALNVLSDSSEIVNYDSNDIPIRTAQDCLSSFFNMSALCHWHQDIEFIYIVDGEMMYFVDGENHLLQKGMGIFVNSQQLHYGYSSSGKNCEFQVFMFHPSLLCSNPYIESKYVTPIITNKNYKCIVLNSKSSWMAEILNLLQKTFSLLQKKEKSFELKSQINISSLWLLIYENSTFNSITSAADNKLVFELKSMITYMQNHYNEKILLSDIASSGAVCRSKCCSLFKKYLNTTPNEYLNKLRLQKSIELLANPNLTIIEIAFACGFSNASYYTEMFHKIIGMTPKEFRAKNIKK